MRHRDYGNEHAVWSRKILVLAIGCFLPVAVVSLSGCGRPSYQLDTARVHGTVTLDGLPLPSGYVFLATARGRQARGRIQSDGTFVLSTYDKGDGAQVGTHPVIISPVPPDEAAERRVVIPARYTRSGTSGLSVEVKPGVENVLDIVLTSKK